MLDDGYILQERATAGPSVATAAIAHPAIFNSANGIEFCDLRGPSDRDI